MFFLVFSFLFFFPLILSLLFLLSFSPFSFFFFVPLFFFSETKIKERRKMRAEDDGIELGYLKRRNF